MLAGIFPASHIFVRDDVSDAGNCRTKPFDTLSSPAHGRMSEEVFASRNRSVREMDLVREDEEVNDAAAPQVI